MMSGRWSAMAGLLIVLVLFCAPLFVNLGGLDLRNDEPIYAYAVDRILETGEWLTPRSIQVDGPFLEKPPLKFWMLAGLIRTGLVSNDEFGMRILDVVMGAIGFIYVYLIGVRLAGPLCGVASMLMLFAFDWLVFEHGLRSNNMEAPLFLSYCGAMYHLTRWVEVERRRRLHALAVCAYFVLGFMTKFVAALFLPMIVALCVVTIPLVRQRVRAYWRDWLSPIVLSVAAVAPWFIYETITFGAPFWRVILGEHVYTRFTSALDPFHLRPWHFYFTETWAALTFAQSRTIAVAAGVALLVKAWQGDPWQMRLLLAWWIVPFALMSAGTSKLYHYAYPFLPPIALAVGWFSAAIVQAAGGPAGDRLSKALRRSAVPASGHGAGRARLARGLLAITAAGVFSLAIVTGLNGPVIWRVGATTIFQNSSVVRPLAIAAVCLWLARKGAVTLRPIAALILAFALPVSTYAVKAARATEVDDRWRSLRDCAAEVGRSDAVATGVHAIALLINHAAYYYLYRLGPWTSAPHPDDPEIRTRLFAVGRQTPVLLTTTGYKRLEQIAAEAHWAEVLPAGVIIDSQVVLLPGPYEECVSPAARAGAERTTAPHGTGR